MDAELAVTVQVAASQVAAAQQRQHTEGVLHGKKSRRTLCRGRSVSSTPLHLTERAPDTGHKISAPVVVATRDCLTPAQLPLGLRSRLWACLL